MGDPGTRLDGTGEAMGGALPKTAPNRRTWGLLAQKMMNAQGVR